MRRLNDFTAHGYTKVRDWVQCAAWTRPASPQDFADDVARAAADGYRVMHGAQDRASPI